MLCNEQWGVKTVQSFEEKKKRKRGQGWDHVDAWHRKPNNSASYQSSPKLFLCPRKSFMTLLILVFYFYFFINYFNLKKGRGEPRRPAPLVDADFCRSRRPTVYVHTVLCHLQPYYYYITLTSMKFLSYEFICATVSCKHCTVYEYKYIILNFFNFYWRDIDNVTLKVCFIL